MSELRRRRSAPSDAAEERDATEEPPAAEPEPEPAPPAPTPPTTIPAWLSLQHTTPAFSAATCAAVLATFLACTSRLWRLEHPQTPVYDETHVGRFLNWCAAFTTFTSKHSTHIHLVSQVPRAQVLLRRAPAPGQAAHAVGRRGARLQWAGHMPVRVAGALRRRLRDARAAARASAVWRRGGAARHRDVPSHGPAPARCDAGRLVPAG